MVNCGDVCTYGFLYSAGQVVGPGNRPASVQKAKSAKNDRNHRRLPPIEMTHVVFDGETRACAGLPQPLILKLYKQCIELLPYRCGSGKTHLFDSQAC